MAGQDGTNTAISSPLGGVPDIPTSLPMPISPLKEDVPPGDTFISVDIPISTLFVPRSKFKVYNPETGFCGLTSTPISEVKALRELQKLDRRPRAPLTTDDDGEQDLEYYLDDFAMYTKNKLYPDDLHGLQGLFGVGVNIMYFDGVLSRGDRRYQVQNVPFEELSIGGYGQGHSTVGGEIWIRSSFNLGKPAVSHHGVQRGIWYKLRSPGLEYLRFFKPFLWLADLAKHVVDYCEAILSHDSEAQLGIHRFRSEFLDWLENAHRGSREFQAWAAQHPSRDYRSAISNNAKFLWKEVNGALDASLKPSKITLFHEIMSFDRYREHKRDDNSTIVTPYIYDLFKHLESGAFLRKVVQLRDRDRNGPQTLEIKLPSSPTNLFASRAEMIDSIRPGDVISTHPDGKESGTKWKAGRASDKWYCLVQKVLEAGRGERKFHITWFYQPHDTPCCEQTYPWANELFLSDHCSCHGGNDKPVRESEVIGKHSVEWFGDQTSKSEFFVRQIYIIEHRRWVTLKRSDLKCDENNQEDDEHARYQVGDTVLAGDPEGERLEPFVITELTRKDGQNVVGLRRLDRRRVVDPESPNAEPNELVYTNKIVVRPASWLHGRCTIRLFQSRAQVVPPYDRKGTGNCFFITHRKAIGDDGKMRFLPMSISKTFKQGFLPGAKGCKPMRGLDLFAGCGNLGRGIEEGGAVKVKWVNDIWSQAIHTYMANTKHPEAVHPYLGSVDHLLEDALKGKTGPLVPAQGEVEFISGGSPCQGFSLLTNNKDRAPQKKNRSLVASFASFVDFYRPKYGILENVIGIVRGAKSKRPQDGADGGGTGQDYFSQLICAIVGMGYQAQIMLGDAWTHGAPQSRERVFLLFALPGHRLPEQPMASHSHPDHVKSRGLGLMSNSEPYVMRKSGPTAFRYVTVAEATGDLPPILDGRPEICVPFPDHRSKGLTPIERKRVALIPTAPWGMGFTKAWAEGQGVMTEAEREIFPWDSVRTRGLSRAYSRVAPNRLFSTITTRPQHTDARTGRALHYREQRTVSILEIRRGQGLPDHEVLVGDVMDRWKLVGNSVARQSALALGLELRRAVWGSLYEEGEEEIMGGGGGVAVAVSVGLKEEDPLPSIPGRRLAAGEEVRRPVRNGVAVSVDVTVTTSAETDAPEAAARPALRPQAYGAITNGRPTVAAAINVTVNGRLPPGNATTLANGSTAQVKPVIETLLVNGNTGNGNGSKRHDPKPMTTGLWVPWPSPMPSAHGSNTTTVSATPPAPGLERAMNGGSGLRAVSMAAGSPPSPSSTREGSRVERPRAAVAVAGTRKRPLALSDDEEEESLPERGAKQFKPTSAAALPRI